MLNFLKGIVVGLGGISPGLSGSVLLVIFGLYQKTVTAIGTLFKNFKKNVLFLLPICLGMGCGILLFSKIIDFFVENYEMQTRYAFLGLVLGTIPLFYKEVKKNGFKKRYWLVMLFSAVLGTLLTIYSSNLFPPIENPNFLQSLLLGVAVAGAFIVPGVDSAVILSALGLYGLFVSALADFNLKILIPAACGLAVAALAISFIMNLLLKHAYTATFSVIFGLFISIIPTVLKSEESGEFLTLARNSRSVICIILTVIGFLVSFYLGDIKGNNQKLKKLFRRDKI